MQKYSDVVLDKNGKAIQGATVTVVTYPGGMPSAVYAADGGPALPAVKTDENGRFAFYAPNGHYSVTVSGTGITPVTYNDVVLFDATDNGAAKVGWFQSGVGALMRWIQDKMRETVSPDDFGAVGDFVADDTVAVQKAIDSLPAGGMLLVPHGKKYRLTDEVRVSKPIKIKGGGAGSFINETAGGFYQTVPGKNAFTLVATKENYAFGQFGIVGVDVENIAIVGPSNASRGRFGIGVDTSVNGGDFHIRELTFRNVNIRYFTDGYNLTGIAYLNRWFGGCVNNCGTGVRIAQGAASDRGGQNRWYGWTAVLNEVCASLNEDTSGGSFNLFGCTLSESRFGVRTGPKVQLTINGGEFEANTYGNNGASIYIPISDVANPNSSAPITILGAKFLTSDADIWIDKTTSAYAGGGFAFPCLIDGNYLGSNIALKITVPAGHTGINSKQFVLGPSNSGPSGPVTIGQVSANFLGYDTRTWATKTAPAGAVVGTSDTQTLSNKTLSGSVKQTSAPFADVAYTVTTGLSTAGNAARLIFAENDGANQLAAVTVYGSGYGGSPSRNSVMTLGTQGVERLWFGAAEWRPMSDNAMALGGASYRWAKLYAVDVSVWPPASNTPASNGQMVFELTSDTLLKIKAKGSDGVVRSVSLTLT